MKRKLKKFFAVFSVLVCLVSVNLSLFTVGASANVVEAGDYSYRTIGAPVSLSFYTITQDLDGFYNNYYGFINRPNVYYYSDEDNTFGWYEGTSTDNYFNFYYSVLDDSTADIFLNFNSSFRTSVDSLRIDSPILFEDFTDLDYHFNFLYGLYQPTDALGNSMSTVVASYWYTFLTGSLVDSQLVLETSVVRKSVRITSDPYGYFRIPLFNSDILTENLIKTYKNFSSSSNVEYCYLIDGGFSLLGAFSNINFIEPVRYAANSDFTEYKDILNNRFKDIYQAQDYEEVIVFEDLSWTDWIVNSVGAFLDFEIMPGLTFAGMLGLLVGMSLFIVFLKIFAGG